MRDLHKVDGAATSGTAVPARSTMPPGGDLPAALTQAGSENFPVAPRFLPRRVRGQLRAIYGYARTVDDIGDEAAGDRLRALDALEADLDRLYGPGDPSHPAVAALVSTVVELDIPPEPFYQLIAANRQDQWVSRYPRFEDLLGYCALSANPVGRLVLHVFSAATPQRMGLADQVCTGLQLVEHWQDVAEDYGRGRVYLPLEDLAAFGCQESELAGSSAGPAMRRLLAFEAGRAGELLDRGAPLARTLSGTARLAVTGFVAGGRAALAGLERRGFDPLPGPPRRSRATIARKFALLLLSGR